MDAKITESAVIALAGLIGVVALLFLAITRFKWHVFLAVLIPILLFALVPGIDRKVFISAFETGFGRTVQSSPSSSSWARCSPKHSSTPARSNA